NLIAVVGRLGSRPGAVGDRIFNDVGSVAVVGVVSQVAVNRKQGGKALSKVAGSFGADILFGGADLHVQGVQADIAVAEEVIGQGLEDVAVRLAVGVVRR